MEFVPGGPPDPEKKRRVLRTTFKDNGKHEESVWSTGIKDSKLYRTASPEKLNFYIILTVFVGADYLKVHEIIEFSFEYDFLKYSKSHQKLNI